MHRSLFFILPLVFLASHGFARSTEPILKLVGAEEDQIVTQRTVWANIIVDAALYKPQSLQSGYKLPDTDSDEFKLALDHVLIEMTVSDEAKQFGVAKVSEQEVTDNVATVKKSIESSPAKPQWTELQINNASLREMVERKLRANRFIKYKQNTIYVQPTDEEVRDYFDRHRGRFGSDADFEEYKPMLLKRLGEKNAEQRLRDWMDVLRRKHKVKNFLSAIIPHGNSSTSDN